MKWTQFIKDNKKTHPPERKWILVGIEPDKKLHQEITTVCVGYLRYAAGDKTSPYFVLPGAFFNDDSRKEFCYCDCLPDNYYHPKYYEE